MCNTKVFLVAALFQFYFSTAYVIKPEESLIKLGEDDDTSFPLFDFLTNNQQKEGNDGDENISTAENFIRFLSQPEGEGPFNSNPIVPLDPSNDKIARQRRQMATFNDKWYGGQDQNAARQLYERFRARITSEAQCMQYFIQAGFQSQEDFFKAERICRDASF